MSLHCWSQYPLRQHKTPCLVNAKTLLSNPVTSSLTSSAFLSGSLQAAACLTPCHHIRVQWAPTSTVTVRQSLAVHLPEPDPNQSPSPTPPALIMATCISPVSFPLWTSQLSTSAQWNYSEVTQMTDSRCLRATPAKTSRIEVATLSRVKKASLQEPPGMELQRQLTSNDSEAGGRPTITCLTPRTKASASLIWRASPTFSQRTTRQQFNQKPP